MTNLVRVGCHVVEAHANWGAWAAKCDRCPWGGRLQRFTPSFECPFCGLFNEVIWPSEEMVKGVERLLMMRPDPSTRNWWPHETLHHLMWENGEHGLLSDPGIELMPGESFMVLDDHSIRFDNVPAIKHRVRKEIDA